SDHAILPLGLGRRATMARTVATLPAGARITDYISLGVITKTFPLTTVRAVLAASGKASLRERDLPAHVVMYYVIALALFMQASYREVLRCLLEGLQWLRDPATPLKVAGKSGISQARTRLGWEALRPLHDAVVRPIARPATRGAWYRQWRLVSLDGSTLDVADEAANTAAFGRPGSSRGGSAYPQIRFVSLVENGTHVLFGSHMAGCETGEIPLARDVLTGLQPDMLCLADRQFFGFALWQQACATGTALLWRIKKNIRLPCAKRLLSLSKGRRLLPEPSLFLGACPPAQDQGGEGACHRVPSGRRGWSRTLVSADHHHPRSRSRPGARIGGAPSRALGNRDRSRRTEDPSARRPHRAAQQNPGSRAAGVLRADPGAFRGPRLDARGRVAGRRRSRSALVCGRRPCRAP